MGFSAISGHDYQNAKRFWDENLRDSKNPAALLWMPYCGTAAVNPAHIEAFGHANADLTVAELGNWPSR